ncbi:MAG: glycosyltransferase family 2 protein [Sphingomonadales bacterium]
MWTLSVCIPVYNTDVRALVAELCSQIDSISSGQIDLILLDDASTSTFQALNQFTHPRVKLVVLPQNVGRAKIRNAFLRHTYADYLLFIDGDSTIKSPTFLADYKNYLDKHPASKVLVGASCYQQNAPVYSKRLRWKYSTKRESLSFSVRKENPAHGFKTNNFLVDRKVLEQNPFDENLAGYGHEDTLFGLQLQQNQIPIAHIDNPVWNLHVDTNRVFIQKTDQALRNLLWIHANYNLKSIDLQSRLLTQYVTWKKRGGIFLILLKSLSLAAPILKGLLLTGLSPIFIFDAYRLGRLYQLDKNATNYLL